MKNTFVINVDADVAEFLERETGGTGDANAYINQILVQEQQRQARAGSGRDNTDKPGQDLAALEKNTPDAAH